MAARIYKDKAGKRLPSVTTVISRFKESGGLVHWAWSLGIEGKDYRAERDKAADAGTLAHAMVEARLRGEEWSPSGPVDAVIKLIEEKLPGWAVTVGQNVHHRHWLASINNVNVEGEPYSVAQSASKATPALALLAAALRAIASQEGE